MSMDPIPSDRHLRDLRKLYDHIESHVRSLRSLGIEATSYGALLSPILLSKLPPDLRLIVSRKVSDSNLDMDALLTTFEEELTARKRANQNPQPTRRNVEKPRQTASVFLSTSQNIKPDPRCCYCEQNHLSSSCPTVTSLVDRKHILKTSGRCYNCLRKNHLSRSCKSTSRCLKCRRKHHTSICDHGQGQSPVTQHPTSEPVHTDLAELNPLAPPFESPATTRTHTTLCSDQVPAVLLQTARAVIHHPGNPHLSLEVHLILDSGSQKSYISERA